MAKDPEGTITSVISWTKKSSLAVLDQGLFAGAHFILNILLARWLEPAQYGAFALAYSVFLLLAAYHSAILTEPMMVFGAGKYRERFQKYLGILLYGHLGLMVPIGLVLLAASILLNRCYSSDVGGGLLGLSIAGPLILLLWFTRRAFYVLARPGWAAAGGSLYLAVLLGTIYSLQISGRLSHTKAFIMMGLSALIVSVFFIRLLRPHWAPASGNPIPAVVASDHWRYGRWAMATAGIMWLPGNIYYLILPALVGLEGVGALKALMNLAMPAMHTMGSISLLLVPILSGRFTTDGITALAGPMKTFLYAFLALAGAYLLVLATFNTQILTLLYQDRYTGYASLVPLVGLVPLAAGVTAVFGGALRAMGRPDRVFWCYLTSSTVAIGAGIPLAATLGLKGALLALPLSSFTTATMMYVSYNGLSTHPREA